MTLRVLRFARRSPRAAALALSAFAAPLVVIIACDANVVPVGLGGECFLATDCQPGLVCIEQPNTSRICSDNLDRVVGQAPAEAGVADAQGDAERDGRARDTGTTTEASVPPPPENDSGGAAD